MGANSAQPFSSALSSFWLIVLERRNGRGRASGRGITLKVHNKADRGGPARRGFGGFGRSRRLGRGACCHRCEG